MAAEAPRRRELPSVVVDASAGFSAATVASGSIGTKLFVFGDTPFPGDSRFGCDGFILEVELALLQSKEKLESPLAQAKAKLRIRTLRVKNRGGGDTLDTHKHQDKDAEATTTTKTRRNTHTQAPDLNCGLLSF